MKKILFVISLFALMFLFGCSASMEYTTTVSEGTNDIIQYDFNNFRFSNLNESSLLYHISDEAIDLSLMLEKAYDNGYGSTDVLLESDNGVIYTLVDISIASGTSLKSIVKYSASELNTVALANDISLTVDDVVGFVDLASILEDVPNSIYLSGKDYLELRLDRDLIQVEELGVNDFQEAYTLLENNSLYDFSEKTFLEIIDDLDSIGVVYTQTELDSIEIGYDLIMSLMS